MTRLHVTVLAVSLAALGFDLGEIALGGALSAVFSTGRNLATPMELSWLLGSVYVGGALGAWPVGRLADRFGRRNVVIALLSLIALSSFGAACAPDVRFLALMRGLTGIALGVFPVIIVAYLTDLLPLQGRGPVLMFMSALALGGGPLLLLLSALSAIEPAGIEGWRWALFLAGAGAGVSALLFLGMPESPRWLIATGRAGDAERVIRRFGASPPIPARYLRVLGAERKDRTPRGSDRIAGRAMLVGALCVLASCLLMAFPVLNGAILVARGFPLDQSILYVALSSCGSIGGALLAARVLDKVERATALALCGSGMALALAAFFLAGDPLVVVLGSTAFLAFASVYVIALNIYAAELFPVRVRATMTALAWGLLRLGTAVALFALVPLLRGNGPSVVLAIMMGCLLSGMALVMAFGPRSARPGCRDAGGAEAGA